MWTATIGPIWFPFKETQHFSAKAGDAAAAVHRGAAGSSAEHRGLAGLATEHTGLAGSGTEHRGLAGSATEHRGMAAPLLRTGEQLAQLLSSS